MSEEKTVIRFGGINFSSLLTVLFIGLKLSGIITWSWLWVLSPLWIPLGIVTGLFILAGILFILANVIDKVWK